MVEEYNTDHDNYFTASFQKNGCCSYQTNERVETKVFSEDGGDEGCVLEETMTMDNSNSTLMHTPNKINTNINTSINAKLLNSKSTSTLMVYNSSYSKEFQESTTQSGFAKVFNNQDSMLLNDQ